MNKEIEMKQHVLDMLKEFMLGQEGQRFKPKAIQVEMIGKPHEMEESSDEESAEDKAMDKAMSEKRGVSEDEWEDSPEDEEMDEEAKKKPKMSLKDFLASR